MKTICHGAIAFGNNPDRVRGQRPTGFTFEEDRQVESMRKLIPAVRAAGIQVFIVPTIVRTKTISRTGDTSIRFRPTPKKAGFRHR